MGLLNEDTDLTFTPTEMVALKHAISQHNDMKIDMMFDNISSINMFPKDGSPEIITSESAKAFRDELKEVQANLSTIRAIMTKVGIDAHPTSGYSK